jgi:hypothetical protein
MAQMASFFLPRQIAQAWPFMIPILAVPAAAGAFGAGDENRLGGAAYGLIAGTASGIVGWPLAVMAMRRTGSARTGFGGLIPSLALTFGIMAVPAYFAGKRAKGEVR